MIKNTIIYNLSFTAKTYIFGSIADSASGLIKKVDIDYYSNTTASAKREVRYSATPRAIKDYDNDAITQITEDVGLKETIIAINDASTFSAEDYIEIGSETMEIVSVDENTIKVKEEEKEQLQRETLLVMLSMPSQLLMTHSFLSRMILDLMKQHHSSKISKLTVQYLMRTTDICQSFLK